VNLLIGWQGCGAEIFMIKQGMLVLDACKRCLTPEVRGPCDHTWQMTSKLRILDVVVRTSLKQLCGKWLLEEERALAHLEE
jgi:hypothetical protein